MAGTTAWSGAPGAAVVLGAAIGAVLLSQLMVRRGRRIGLAPGYVIGVVGALIATLAVIAGSFPLPARRHGPDRLRQRLEPAVALRRRRPVPADAAGVGDRASSSGARRSAPSSGRTSRPRRRPRRCRSACRELAGAYLVPVVFVGAAAILSFVLPAARSVRARRRDHDATRSHGAARPRASPSRAVLRRPERPGRDRRRWSRSRS